MYSPGSVLANTTTESVETAVHHLGEMAMAALKAAQLEAIEQEMAAREAARAQQQEEHEARQAELAALRDQLQAQEQRQRELRGSCCIGERQTMTEAQRKAGLPGRGGFAVRDGAMRRVRA